jgi:hypothetical protein
MIASTVAACSDSDKKSAADFCTVAKSIVTTQDELDTAMSGTEVPVAEELRTSLTTMLSLVGQLDAVAPAEIADDMGVVVRGFAAFDSALRTVDYDLFRLFSDPAAAAAVEADLAVFESPEMTAAMDAVDDYSLAECGFALDTDGS